MEVAWDSTEKKCVETFIIVQKAHYISVIIVQTGTDIWQDVSGKSALSNEAQPNEEFSRITPCQVECSSWVPNECRTVVAKSQTMLAWAEDPKKRLR